MMMSALALNPARSRTPSGAWISISTGNTVALSSVRAFREILDSVPSTVAPGRAPTLMVTGIPSRSRPTSISSTVPRNRRRSMSAMVIRTVPSW